MTKPVYDGGEDIPPLPPGNSPAEDMHTVLEVAQIEKAGRATELGVKSMGQAEDAQAAEPTSEEDIDMEETLEANSEESRYIYPYCERLSVEEQRRVYIFWRLANSEFNIFSKNETETQLEKFAAVEKWLVTGEVPIQETRRSKPKLGVVK